ncbi:MAG: UDP-N-acetylglucosamine 2-epimerase (non-hydrolyzing) [Dehalococcoidales bacterium]|nr:UDP-N-acetylglucosamine 2-epimerase (non-hydrolyzing) [Dehalococcoidales bacterium]
MKIAVILGTRPEIIKMSPVVRELERRAVDFFILHTGQHYSYNLDGVFFQQLKLRRAKYNLEAGSGSHAEETGKMLIGIEKVLVEERPDAILVEGDTNSVLAGALGAAKLGIKVGHVEAGLRSYDRSMPEEINRVITDHLSDYLYAPTSRSKDILLGEGIPAGKIFVTGNTIVDAVYQNLKIAREKGNALSALNIKPEEYFLVTLHRQENVDNRARFVSILEGLSRVAVELDKKLIYPVHPRSRKMITGFDIKPQHLILTEPVDFLSFLQLESSARLIFTDSGGVQEEACILNVPCVTIRDNTERPETIEVGANILAGASPDKILEGARIMLRRDKNWTNPFGDGKASERIVKIVTEA